jgi:hypothetical protein
MNRYPHKIIIQEVVGERTPYNEPTYETVFEGRCRCFLDKKAAGGDDITANDYQVVIPSPKMVDVGENFKVGVKFQNATNGKAWDLVGFVKDFARYDRVCNLYFQVIKDNQIEGEI